MHHSPITHPASPKAPETKNLAHHGEDLGSAFDDFMQSFELFKQANDERLDQVEKRSLDPLADQKVDRISKALDEQKAALDDLIVKGRLPELAPSVGGDKIQSLATRQHSTAFQGYIRKGADSDLRLLEEKALSAGSDPDGGYLVPEQVETEVGRRLSAISPIRAIADVRTVSGAIYKKPFSTQGPQVGWVGETAIRPQTDASNLSELAFTTMELYAMPAATPSLLDDAVVNIEDWLASEVEAAFAEQEGTAFVQGDGINKPKGFMAETVVEESAWSWGNLGSLKTGHNGGFAASAGSDALIDLVYALKAGYRQNAHFVMNRRTQAAVRKLKDADGNYIWQPPASLGAQASLMNFPITEAEDMPDITTGANAIAFGDFKRGYLIVDRQGMRVLRDPYSAKPYVLFYTTKRVGGGVQDFDAIKLLNFAE